jgi:hypothetical protein
VADLVLPAALQQGAQCRMRSVSRQPIDLVSVVFVDEGLDSRDGCERGARPGHCRQRAGEPTGGSP